MRVSVLLTVLWLMGGWEILVFSASIFRSSWSDAMLFSMAWTSVKPLVLQIERTRAFYPWRQKVTQGPDVLPNCILCVPLLGLEVYDHCLGREFLFLISDCIDRSGTLLSLWSTAKNASILGSNIHKRMKLRPSTWLPLVLKSLK